MTNNDTISPFIGAGEYPSLLANPPVTELIPFNMPFLTGKETEYIRKAVELAHTSGNGYFTKECHSFFKKRYGFQHVLLTSSCTDALEMCALLLDLGPSDEVIVPSYTFVSTANSFALRGVRLRFADSLATSPNIDPASIERQITPATKAIVVVHYAGVACDMDAIMKISHRYSIPVIEDAAHSIESCYNDRPLGSIGHLATFSFHETKNVISGEGGMLVVNDKRFIARSEVLWEKGTNRTAFARGEVQKYLWLDLGSSFLPSDLIAAFLLAQLEEIEHIQAQRISVWKEYLKHLSPLIESGHLSIPNQPSYSTQNGHLFAIITKSAAERTALMEYLKAHLVSAVFHYLPLHLSPFASRYGEPEDLPNATRYGECLLRLPLFYKLPLLHVQYICQLIRAFFEKSR